jgi:hypothetical protein
MRRTQLIVACVSVCSITAAALLMMGYFQRRYAMEPLPAPYPGPAEPTPRQTYISLPQTEVRQLLSGNCTTVVESRKLPDQIKNGFATITRDKPFALADPGARFNATDVMEPGLPRRRLVLAGGCDDRWFIEYEHGGIGLSIALMVLRINRDQSVTLLWGRPLREKARNLDELRTALNNAEFWDAPYYW